jgi:Fe-S cluster biosynthesis and repair protein YggX
MYSPTVWVVHYTYDHEDQIYVYTTKELAQACMDEFAINGWSSMFGLPFDPQKSELGDYWESIEQVGGKEWCYIQTMLLHSPLSMKNTEANKDTWAEECYNGETELGYEDWLKELVDQDEWEKKEGLDQVEETSLSAPPVMYYDLEAGTTLPPNKIVLPGEPDAFMILGDGKVEIVPFDGPDTDDEEVIFESKGKKE